MQFFKQRLCTKKHSRQQIIEDAIRMFSSRSKHLTLPDGSIVDVAPLHENYFATLYEQLEEFFNDPR